MLCYMLIGALTYKTSYANGLKTLSMQQKILSPQCLIKYTKPQLSGTALIWNWRS